MIRRDYILRMIEEFIKALNRIQALKKDQRWNDLDQELDAAFKKLIGLGAEAISKLSETELLAALIQGESTMAVNDKTLLLATLLNEAADANAIQGKLEQSREIRLKSIHLILEITAREENHIIPAFVPKIDAMLSSLGDAPIPLRTLGMLMLHYERIGAFAKAEDALFAMLESEPNNNHLVAFGVAFYNRLQGQSDAALLAGNLPRTEVEQGLEELRLQQSSPQL